MAESTCSIDGCDKPYFGRGWCNMHYSRWRRHGDPHHIGRVVYGEPIERFTAKIDQQPDGCWTWTAYVNDDGYGVFNDVDNEPCLAHRWSYEHHCGPVPDSHEVDHLCHNRDPDCPGGVTCLHRRCVNPDHLEPVTTAENVDRAPQHYGARDRCDRGHPFDQENTLVRSDGGRRCRTCKRRRTRDYMRRQRAANRKA